MNKLRFTLTVSLLSVMSSVFSHSSHAVTLYEPGDIARDNPGGVLNQFNENIAKLNGENMVFKSPLRTFGLGFGLAADFKESKFGAKMFYGFDKSKISGLGGYYGLRDNLKVGLLLINGSGKSKGNLFLSTTGYKIASVDISEKMSAAFTEATYYFKFNGIPVSPYITARLGYAKHKLNVTTTSLIDGQTPVGKVFPAPADKYDSLAYGFGLGTEFKFTHNIGMDLSYHLDGYGSKSRITDASPSTGNKDTDQVRRAGLTSSARLLLKVSF